MKIEEIGMAMLYIGDALESLKAMPDISEKEAVNATNIYRD